MWSKYLPVRTVGSLGQRWKVPFRSCLYLRWKLEISCLSCKFLGSLVFTGQGVRVVLLSLPKTSFPPGGLWFSTKPQGHWNRNTGLKVYAYSPCSLSKVNSEPEPECSRIAYLKSNWKVEGVWPRLMIRATMRFILPSMTVWEWKRLLLPHNRLQLGLSWVHQGCASHSACDDGGSGLLSLRVGGVVPFIH